MIHGDIEVSGHIPPRRRVDLDPLFVEPKRTEPETTTEICARLDRTSRGNRVWECVVGTATGSNIAGKEPNE